MCGICGESLEPEYKQWLDWKAYGRMAGRPKRTKINISIDHIKPKSKMREPGLFEKRWELENLQLAHITCNNKKGNK